MPTGTWRSRWGGVPTTTGVPPQLPGQLVELAALCGADCVLGDPYEKRPNESLVTRLTRQELHHLRYCCRAFALRFAVAGNLQPGHELLLKNVQPRTMSGFAPH